VEDQLPNLIQLTILQDGLPTIKMVTEAGIIGKIGLNSDGVGVCFNAIRANGVDKSRLPVHLGLRMALESKSAKLAAEMLESIGMASSAYIVVGDATTAIGLEFTSTTFLRVPVNNHGFLVHSNHMLLQHENIYEPKWLEDSYTRLQTMGRKILQTKELSRESFSGLFEDEYDFPCSISRAQEGASDCATLFNIAIDFKKGLAVVREGRPTSDRTSPTMCLQFEASK
jgi:isopenicillin-N N-acyltransferase-like protein